MRMNNKIKSLFGISFFVKIVTYNSKSIKNKLIIVLLAFLISAPASSNPEEGIFYGMKLNESIEKTNESKVFWDTVGIKYLISYKNIFDNAIDQITVQVTPITNTVFSIKISTLFNDSSESKEFFNKYRMYFHGKYPESNDPFISDMFGSYDINGEYIISIKYIHSFNQGDDWTNNLDEDFFNIEEINSINSPINDIYSIGGIKLASAVVFSFNYNRDSTEFIELMDKNDQELKEYMIKYGLENGVIAP